LDLWEFGSARLFTARSTGVTLVRDARAAGGASYEAVAIGVQGLGSGRHETSSGQRIVRSGELMMVDITRPFDFSWSGTGSSTSLQVPISDLGLPVRVVQRAAERLRRSPLYRIVSRHIVDLTADADTLSASRWPPTSVTRAPTSSGHCWRTLRARATPAPGTSSRRRS
jgi:hypothetical protein